MVGAIIPWNGPLDRDDLEDRPGARDRLHRGAEAGRGSAADAAAPRRAVPGGRRAAGRGQRRAGLRRDRRRGAGRAPGRRQGGLHRLAPDRPEDRPGLRRQPQARVAGARRQVARHRLRRRRPRRGGARRRRWRCSPTPARSAAPARGCSSRRQVYDEFVERSPTFCEDAEGRRRPPIPRRRSGRWSRPSSSSASPATSASAGRKAPRPLVGRRAADRRRVWQGLLRAADGVRRRARRHAHRAGGDLRPGDLGDPVHRHRGGRSERGNDTTFGLGSGVWTRDVSKAHRSREGIRAGSVWVNCYQAMDPAVPFGGYKMSGYGRESGIAARRGVPQRQGGLDQDRLSSPPCAQLGEVPCDAGGGVRGHTRSLMTPRRRMTRHLPI